MKAEELMIGDWVCQRESGLTLKVSKINPPYIEAEGEGGQFHEDTLRPLRATGDILTANGFTLCEGCTSAWEWSSPHSYDSIRVCGIGTRMWPEQRLDVCKNTRSVTGNGFYRALNDYDFIGVHRLQQVIRMMWLGVRIESVPKYQKED